MKLMKILLILISSLISMASYGMDDFDFALIASDCKTTVSLLKVNEKSLQTFNGDKPIYYCKRNSKIITCKVTFQDLEQKESVQKYSVITDSPPFLIIATENNSELTMINTNEMAAAHTSRIIDEKYMGNKVCSMTFMTQDQIKSLSNKKNK